MYYRFKFYEIIIRHIIYKGECINQYKKVCQQT